MVKSILYLGHFDNTGYGQAAQGYVNALLSNNYNVVCRHFPLNGSPSNDLPDNIKNCLKKPANSCDYLIQHTLPVYWQFQKGFKKNIGLFVYEMDSVKGSGWEDRIQMMDAVIVANSKTFEMVKDLNREVYLIPHAFDIDKYFRNYKAKKLKLLENSFKFYTIGEFTSRKNLEDTIRAFHTSFNKTSNVDLVIKTNRSGVPSHVLKEQIRNYCTDIKKRMKLYGENLSYYKDEIIITERLSENDLFALHQSCQVFVNTSFGEGFSIPTFDAFGFRKPIVYVGDSYDYLGKNTINFQNDYAYNNIDSIPELYTGYQVCHKASIKDIAFEMQKMYLYYKTQCEKAKEKAEKLDNYSYLNVGKQFGVALNG